MLKESVCHTSEGACGLSGLYFKTGFRDNTVTEGSKEKNNRSL